MAVTEEERERMLDGLVALRRLRAVLHANSDLERGISGIKTALGETVPQRTAAKALGIKHPELSKLISAGSLKVRDTVGGRSQVEVDSLVELIEADGVAPREEPAWKRRRAEREAEETAGAGSSEKDDLARIMKMRALAFHRALARNLDSADLARAREIVAEWRESEKLSAEQADEWEKVLGLPPTDVAARMTDFSPAGEALRANSPFQAMGRRSTDPH
ncbi:MAG: hypothetical protein QM648_09490 [Solirubrobacterales bacterium]